MPKSVFNKNTRAPVGIAAAFAETERLIQKTQRDALGLFHARGILDRKALVVWLNGARDACWHVTDIVERDTVFVITISLPGVHAGFVELTREPRQLVIRSRTAPNSADSEVLRRLDLPLDLNSELVAAELREGALVISIPRAH